MKVQLIAVGTKMPAWVTQGYSEYAKRLPRELSPQLVEIPIGHRGKNANIQDVKEAEGKAIQAALNKNTRVVALEVKGKAWSTENLAERVQAWQMEGQDVAFIIGGPDGLSAECLGMASEKWSLSNLTLPHPLVRIVFIEQLYRAWTITQNHPYHK